MFENVQMAPPDAIFGLNDKIARDPRPQKIHLGAGVYKDDAGKTPILAVVKEAERRLLDGQASKSYLPIDGLPEYRRLVAELLLGEQHRRWQDGDAVCVQTPGGTGALRVAAELVAHRGSPAASVWISDPTWPNHPEVFAAAGLKTQTYRYFDQATHGLAFDAMCSDLEGAQPGDLVVLHGCCHNPTGVDLSPEQQEALSTLVASRQLVPLVDFAYQGFARGIEEDAQWLRRLAERSPEILIASSSSKNFGLYNERVGALTAMTESPKTTAAVHSRIKQVVRANYSNPPSQGAAIVSMVLADSILRGQWRQELTAMRQRIHDMRQRLKSGLDERGVRLHASGNHFITQQNGMFSFSGLTTPQVRELQERFAVYALDSGRINVAGITSSNIEPLCDAIAAVLKKQPSVVEA